MSKISIRTPATSANIGPGFDTLGIAFSLYNIFTFEEKESGLSFCGCDAKYQNSNNLTYIAYKLVAEKAEKNIGGLSITFDSAIPVSRGLGSSASLISAGAFAANTLLSCGFSKKELLEICTPLEGHADNLAPALLGGFTAAIADGKKVFSVNLDISDKLKFFALVPNFETKTENARAVLPKEISRNDTVFNISHAVLLIKAMSDGDVELMSYAINDRIHEPYRRKLIYNFDSVKETAKSAGADVFFISGSGSTCMCISENNIENTLKEAVSTLPHGWKVFPLSVDKSGTCLI